MKKLLTVLGAAALIAGVTPYRYSRSEETGEQKIQALLWEAIRTPVEGKKDKTTVNIGFVSPFERKKGEHEIFADGITVEYGGGVEEEEPVPEEEEPEAEPAQETEAAEDPAETEPETAGE